jgi:hypothetical protein
MLRCTELDDSVNKDPLPVQEADIDAAHRPSSSQDSVSEHKEVLLISDVLDDPDEQYGMFESDLDRFLLLTGQFSIPPWFGGLHRLAINRPGMTSPGDEHYFHKLARVQTMNYC